MSAGVLVQGCLRCDGPIDYCEFCEATDCRTPICHRCLRLAVGQAVVQPHVRAGAVGRRGAAAAFVARPGKVLDPLVEPPEIVSTDLAEVAERILVLDG